MISDMELGVLDPPGFIPEADKQSHDLGRFPESDIPSVKADGRVTAESQHHIHVDAEANIKDTVYVEMEMRFLLPEGIRAIMDRLLKIGATLKQTRSFSDVYYDTDTNHLALSDVWLRKRDGCWQLKLPATVLKKTNSCESTDTCPGMFQYVEYQNPSEILSQLKKVFGVGPGQELDLTYLTDDTHDLVTYLSTRHCLPFASFVTERHSYRLGDDVTVDLDMADFGYNVGEIEVLVPVGAPRELATKKINSIAQILGVPTATKIPSKLLTYISQHYPVLYRQLLDMWGLM